MFYRLFRSAKRVRSINNVVRLYCNTSEGSIVKIGDKCYIPVPCPANEKSVETSDKYIRISRGEPDKVRLGFIPDKWFTFFYQKTGVTGPYVLLVSLSSFLITKEIYVMEHEYYVLLSFIIILYVTVTRIGPQFAKSIDKSVDEYEHSWNSNRISANKNLEDSIALENKLQQSMDGQLMLQDAKKENVGLQLENAYRERILIVYKDVKRRLDFQVAKTLIEKKFLHRNLIEWVINQVIASYTPEKQKETIEACLTLLSTISAKYKRN